MACMMPCIASAKYMKGQDRTTCVCSKLGGACVLGCSGRALEEDGPVRRHVGRRHRARPVRGRRRGAPKGRLQARGSRRGRRNARGRGAPGGRERRLVRGGPRGGGLGGRGRERGRRRGARRREAEHAGVGDGQRVHAPVGERQACAHSYPVSNLPNAASGGRGLGRHPGTNTRCARTKSHKNVSDRMQDNQGRQQGCACRAVPRMQARPGRQAWPARAPFSSTIVLGRPLKSNSRPVLRRA